MFYKQSDYSTTRSLMSISCVRFRASQNSSRNNIHKQEVTISCENIARVDADSNFSRMNSWWSAMFVNVKNYYNAMKFLLIWFSQWFYILQQRLRRLAYMRKLLLWFHLFLIWGCGIFFHWKGILDGLFQILFKIKTEIYIQFKGSLDYRRKWSHLGQS